MPDIIGPNDGHRVEIVDVDILFVPDYGEFTRCLVNGNVGFETHERIGWIQGIP